MIDNIVYMESYIISIFYRCSVPMFVANLQPAPPIPPENIVTEHDRQLQLNYEQWLNNQDVVLGNQQKYYQCEVTKLRKTRKSLNSKQRGLKKAGNDLTPSEAMELTKITSDQSIVQKQLDSARKQAKAHCNIMQDYRSKQQAKMQPQMISSINHPGSSPAQQIAPQSPLMSPSPSSNSQTNIQQAAQSPLGNPMLQPSCSPLQSPSPLLSQSPGPGNNAAILQSPSNQGNSSMSPYNSMQPSPRIGTPHSQEEGPFSPGGIG